jgi:Na+(H+)/acetate symporter ActP
MNKVAAQLDNNSNAPLNRRTNNVDLFLISGANMMGSLVGGLLQSITFITGIKALLLIVAMLYLAAMLCDLHPKGNRSTTSPLPGIC